VDISSALATDDQGSNPARVYARCLGTAMQMCTYNRLNMLCLCVGTEKKALDKNLFKNKSNCFSNLSVKTVYLLFCLKKVE
jgi:hypothetical protein